MLVRKLQADNENHLVVDTEGELMTDSTDQ